MLHTFLFLPRTLPGISRELAKPIPKGMERRYYTSIGAVTFKQIISGKIHGTLTDCHIQ